MNKKRMNEQITVPKQTYMEGEGKCNTNSTNDGKKYNNKMII